MIFYESAPRKNSVSKLQEIKRAQYESINKGEIKIGKTLDNLQLYVHDSWLKYQLDD